MNNSGNEVTAQALLEQSDWMRALARALVRDSAAAEDLMQDTWLAALRGRPDAERDLRPWLSRVMRNFARERFRSRRRSEAREEEVARRGRELPSPSELAERVELQQLVVRIVMGLPQPLRTTVLLCYFEGLRPSEVARRTGEPAGTVRWRLKQGLDRVRDELDRRHGGDRKKWQAALTPLAFGPRETAAVGASSALLWVAAAVVGAGLAGYWLTKPDPTESLASAAVPQQPTTQVPRDERDRSAREVVGESRVADAPTLEPPAARRERGWLEGVSDFLSRPTTRVRVRFVDEQERPVAGVKLRAGSSGVVVAATSGRDGVAELETRALSDSRYVEFVGVDALARRWSRGATVSFGDELDLGVARLSVGASVRGRVLWPHGGAAAGVAVVVAEAENALDPPQAARHGPMGVEFWRRATTGADGRFELLGLPPGAARLWADGGELGWSWSEAFALEPGALHSELDLRLRELERPAKIVVEVRTPDGRPADGLLMQASGPGGARRSGWSDARIEIDDPASYPRIRELWIADRELRFGPARAQDLEPRLEPHQIVLAAPLRLALEIVDVEGRAVREATASVRDLDSGFELPLQNLGATDGPSSVVVLPTAFELVLSAPGHDVARLGPLAQQPDAAPLRVALERLHELRGRLTGPEGALASTWVQVTPQRSPGDVLMVDGAPCLLDLERCKTVQTDADGRFALTLREAGTWYLECQAKGLAPFAFGPFEFDPRRASAPLELRAGVGGRIEGQARLDDGRPAAKRVIGLTRGDRDARTVRSDGAGRFAFDGVAAGEWRVYAAEALRSERSSVSGPFSGALPADWRLSTNCTVREGETTRLELELDDREPRELVVAVRVDGQPASRRAASLAPLLADPFDARGFGARTELDAKGVARLEYRGRGAWRVWIGVDASLGWDGDPTTLHGPLELELRTGTLVGRVERADRPSPLAAVWRLGDGWFAWRRLSLDDEGRFRLEQAPVGRGAIVSGHAPRSPISSWRLEPLAEFDVLPDETSELLVR